MPPVAIILLSKSHEHIVPMGLPATGSISLTEISGYLVAFLAAALIVVGIEALHKR